MSGDHQHVRAGERHRGRLTAAFVVLTVLMVLEVVVGLLSGSLALLSDAGHMLTDVIGLGMAMAAIHLATRGTQRTTHTFGLYRLEILAALANAALLLGVAAYVLVEAIGRFAHPEQIDAAPVLIVATAGLIANLIAFALLREGAQESINLQGAYLEVLSDTLGSIGVIVGIAVMQVTGWTWVDPAVGIAIALWIVPRTLRLGGQALRILIQAAPPGVDLDRVAADLAGLPDVTDVHDLHVWTLTSEMEVATAHLKIRTGADPHRVLDGARDVLRDGYGIGHATLQVEPDDHHDCGDVTW